MCWKPLGNQLGHVKRMRLAGKIEGQDSEQHQHAAEKGIEKKLDGSVLPARPAPDAYEEVHRQKHQLPEDVKKKKVERDEDPHHPGIEQQKKRKVSLHPLLDAPRGKDAEKTEERGQQNHRDADSVHPDKIVNVIGGYPRDLLDKLETGICRIKIAVEPDGKKQRWHCKEGGNPTDQVVTLGRQEQHSGHPSQGEKSHIGEHVFCHLSESPNRFSCSVTITNHEHEPRIISSNNAT